MTEFKFDIVKVDDIEIKEKGLKFKAYKTIQDNGKFMDVRFRREVTNAPKEPCTIVVDEDKCNVDSQRRYPVLWVEEIKRIEPLAKRESNVSKYFGQQSKDFKEVGKDEDLPY